jgi:hypothetical protein
MGQIFVKVRDKSVDDNGVPTLNNGIDTVVTYKAYQYTQDKYELLFQCTEDGKQVFGKDGSANPNLNAQHRQTAQVRNVAPVANAGPSAKEIAMQAEIEKLKAQLTNQSQPVQEPQREPEKSVVQSAPTEVARKRGPKPKLQELVA